MRRVPNANKTNCVMGGQHHQRKRILPQHLGGSASISRVRECAGEGDARFAIPWHSSNSDLRWLLPSISSEDLAHAAASVLLAFASVVEVKRTMKALGTATSHQSPTVARTVKVRKYLRLVPRKGREVAHLLEVSISRAEVVERPAAVIWKSASDVAHEISASDLAVLS